MTVTALPAASNVEVTGGAICIRDLVVHHGEAAAIARARLEQSGQAGLTDALTRAIPVGLVALNLSTASMDSGSIQRVLDHHAKELDVRARAALSELDALLERLRHGEQDIADTAKRALGQLPAQLDRVLGGEAETVRQAVTQAAQHVQATTLDELRRSLAQHSQSIRQVLSLDTDGPVQALRRDLLTQLDGTRRELAEQLTAVREMLAAAAASKPSATKSSRAVGADFEAFAMELAERFVTAAGDRWEATGAQAGNGTTRRVGDGVARLNSAITGQTPVSIVVEAKHRSRPLTVRNWRDTLAEARTVRQAAGALAIVSSVEQVPGHTGFCRVDDAAFVVAADEPLSLVYQVLREIVALRTVGQHDAEVDLGKVEAQINAALAGLNDLDEMGRLVKTATKGLTTAHEVGGRARSRIHEALTAGLAALHP